MNILSKDISKFIKFAIVGVINTLLNWIIFFLLNSLGIYYIVSNVMAYIIATINSYLWNSKWVFGYKKGIKDSASIKFIVLNIIGLILNTIILFILVDVFSIGKFIALVITTAIVMVINYVVNKVWVFKNKEN